MEPVSDDLDWLIKDCLNTSDVKYRFTAFDAAIRVCLSERDKCKAIERFCPITEKYPELKEHLDKILNPPSNKFELAHKLRQELRKLKERRRDILFQEDILPHLADISSAQDEKRLVNIFRRLQQLTDPHFSSSLNVLIPLIGEKGVDAFRSGLIAFWKEWEPDDGRGVGNQMALLGVSCSLQEGMSFDSLSESLIPKLIKLALKEFDLPKWFGDLIKKYPELVASQIKPMILKELESFEIDPKNTKIHPSFFFNLVCNHPESIDLFEDDILEWAEKHMPLSMNTRTYIVRAFSPEQYRKHLKLLAEQYFKDQKAPSMDDDLFWLAVWLQVDALKALDQLKKFFRLS